MARVSIIWGEGLRSAGDGADSRTAAPTRASSSHLRACPLPAVAVGSMTKKLGGAVCLQAFYQAAWTL